MKLLPLAHNTKIPLAGADWHIRISDDPKAHEQWLQRGFNIGVPVKENGLVVVDFDEKDAGKEFFSAHSEICRMIVETRRGFHFYFTGETSTRKFPHGDIKGNGYCVYPPSFVDKWEYIFIKQEKPFPFPEHLFPRVKDVRSITRQKVKNVDAYLAKIESKQGENGSAGLVRAAAICRDNGLSEAETLLKLLAWNRLPVVSPSWPDEELARTVTRIFNRKE